MKYIFILFLAVLCSPGYSQPVLTSFSPLSAPVGAIVRIKGHNFSSIPGNNIVYMGAVRASVTSATDTSVEVTVPYGATHSNIRLTTGNLTSYSSKKFFIAQGSEGNIIPTTFAPKKDFIAGDYVFSL